MTLAASRTLVVVLMTVGRVVEQVRAGEHQYYLTVTALSGAKMRLGPDASAAHVGFTIAG
jgi:hypothetical protein